MPTRRRKAEDNRVKQTLDSMFGGAIGRKVDEIFTPPGRGPFKGRKQKPKPKKPSNAKKAGTIKRKR